MKTKTCLNWGTKEKGFCLGGNFEVRTAPAPPGTQNSLKGLTLSQENSHQPLGAHLCFSVGGNPLFTWESRWVRGQEGDGEGKRGGRGWGGKQERDEKNKEGVEDGEVRKAGADRKQGTHLSGCEHAVWGSAPAGRISCTPGTWTYPRCHVWAGDAAGNVRKGTPGRRKESASSLTHQPSLPFDLKGSLIFSPSLWKHLLFCSPGFKAHNVRHSP